VVSKNSYCGIHLHFSLLQHSEHAIACTVHGIASIPHTGSTERVHVRAQAMAAAGITPQDKESIGLFIRFTAELWDAAEGDYIIRRWLTYIPDREQSSTCNLKTILRQICTAPFRLEIDKDSIYFFDCDLLKITNDMYSKTNAKEYMEAVLPLFASHRVDAAQGEILFKGFKYDKYIEQILCRHVILKKCVYLLLCESICNGVFPMMKSNLEKIFTELYQETEWRFHPLIVSTLEDIRTHALDALTAVHSMATGNPKDIHAVIFNYSLIMQECNLKVPEKCPIHGPTYRAHGVSFMGAVPI
jgi:hypothetical protein